MGQAIGFAMSQHVSLPTSPTLRKLTAVASLLLVAIVLGCMNLSLGEKTVTYVPPPSDGVPYAQDGKVSVPANGTKTVYYPVPYASIPNLELPDDFNGGSDHLEITDQKPHCFTV